MAHAIQLVLSLLFAVSCVHSMTWAMYSDIDYALYSAAADFVFSRLSLRESALPMPNTVTNACQYSGGTKTVQTVDTFGLDFVVFLDHGSECLGNGEGSPDPDDDFSGAPTRLARTHVGQRADDSRPVSACIRLCPGFRSLTPWQKSNALIHELIHAVGFSKETFAMVTKMPERMLDTYGKTDATAILLPYTHWSGKNLLENGKSYWEHGMLLALTEPVEYVKEYFNCSTISGIYLTKDGEHLRPRYYRQDIMNPLGNMEEKRHHSVYLSFLVLSSLGWYDYDKRKSTEDALAAKTKQWGRGEGCTFIENNCWHHYHVTRDKKHFCFESQSSHCLLYEYSSYVPYSTQYYTNPLLGGPAIFDYCPIWESMHK